jgi:hypothetical protein
MKPILPLLAVLAFGSQVVVPAIAQDADKKTETKTSTQKKPLKNEISKLKRARKENRTVRQVTVNPKKNPAKDWSKNVNNQLNRSSKDVNYWIQGKGKDKRDKKKT